MLSECGYLEYSTRKEGAIGKWNGEGKGNVMKATGHWGKGEGHLSGR